MSGSLALHVEFGPVESFIAEARRTRDSWAGSYLLSYLMAHALVAARAAAATIVYPAVEDDELFQAVESGTPPPAGSTALRVGSLPDRFEAAVTDRAQAARVAEAASRAWQAAWLNLAEAVWQELTAKGWPANATTRKIWDHQVGQPDGGGPWNVRWTVGPYADHGRRWQFYPFESPDPPVDDRLIAGEMSTLGGDRCALRADDDRRPAVRAFWTRTARAAAPPLDLRPNGSERLDAVGLIKRFLHRTALTGRGWEIESSYPSTRTIAAATWLKAVLECNEPDLAQLIEDVDVGLGLAEIAPLPRYRPNAALLALARTRSGAAERLLRYEGGVYFPDSDDAWDDVPEDNVELARGEIRKLLARCEALRIPPPCGFFALLVMDGDRLGRLLTDAPEAKGRLSAALGEFSRGVPAIVEAGDSLGQTLYAGGDDVFALLPLETALGVADRLRIWYQRCLAPLATARWQPTISAAIIYAQVATPLSVLIRQAHSLLERFAKDDSGLGRDAFAVEVWKSGGPILRLGRPWEPLPVDGGPGVSRWIDQIDWATKELREARVSNHFLYSLRTTLEVIEQEGAWALPPERQVDVLLAEHLRARRETDLDRDLERQRVSQLAELLRRRSNVARPAQVNDSLEWEMGRFVRFLTEREA